MVRCFTILCDNDLKLFNPLPLGVSNAIWTATYDIYVNMDTEEKPVTLVYKAVILQSTGEVCHPRLILHSDSDIFIS